MDEYLQLIEKAIKNRDGTPLPNGTLDHARMLMEAMFRTASKSLRILTGTLNARVYGTPEAIERAKQFLANPAHTLSIIFEEPFTAEQADRHPLLAAVRHFPNVKLYSLKPELRDRISSHFAVTDEDSYRYEADKTKPSAVAAFGDKEGMAGTLTKTFDLLTAIGSTPLRLPVTA